MEKRFALSMPTFVGCHYFITTPLVGWMVGGVRKKFQMTNLTFPNNKPSMKYPLKSVPGPADVGVLHGDGDGPKAAP